MEVAESGRSNSTGCGNTWSWHTKYVQTIHGEYYSKSTSFILRSRVYFISETGIYMLKTVIHRHRQTVHEVGAKR